VVGIIGYSLKKS